jgi:hypothetical protein
MAENARGSDTLLMALNVGSIKKHSIDKRRILWW